MTLCCIEHFENFDRQGKRIGELRNNHTDGFWCDTKLVDKHGAHSADFQVLPLVSFN